MRLILTLVIRRVLVGVVFAMPLASQAWTGMYFEFGGGKIFLLGRCLADNIHECNCAIADEDVLEYGDDSYMCWKVEGDKIIFKNDRFNIEKRGDEFKIRVDPEEDDKSKGQEPGSMDLSHRRNSKCHGLG